MFSGPVPFVSEASPVLTVLIWATLILTALSLVFAVVALGLHLWSRRQARTERARRTAWREGLLDVLAGERSPDAFAESVSRAQRTAFLSFLVPYATTVRGEALRQIRAVAAPFLDAVADTLTARWPLVRAQAVQRLGLLGGDAYADALRERLDDPSGRVVGMALRRLAQLGHPEDAERLLGVLDRLQNMDRRQVTSALLELGEDAAPTFRAALADDERSTFVRVCAAETLRWLGDSDAAAGAARLLRDAPDASSAPEPELVAGLLRLIRRVGQSRHVDEVRPYLASEVPFVRIHAARALGRLGDRAEEPLLAALVRGDDSRWVALSAAKSLLELGRPGPLHRIRQSDHPRAALASDVLPAPA